ncbi:hypothetical protein [Bradyrhizobium elkanii]
MCSLFLMRQAQGRLAAIRPDISSVADRTVSVLRQGIPAAGMAAANRAGQNSKKARRMSFRRAPDFDVSLVQG